MSGDQRNLANDLTDQGKWQLMYGADPGSRPLTRREYEVVRRVFGQIKQKIKDWTDDDRVAKPAHGCIKALDTSVQISKNRLGVQEARLQSCYMALVGIVDGYARQSHCLRPFLDSGQHIKDDISRAIAYSVGWSLGMQSAIRNIEGDVVCHEDAKKVRSFVDRRKEGHDRITVSGWYVSEGRETGFGLQDGTGKGTSLE